MALGPFHLAIPVHDLDAARAFYGELLGCREGRSSDRWIDFDFWGHQVVVHGAPAKDCGARAHNPVDGDAVPVPHFGAVLRWEAFDTLAARLHERGVEFLIGPRTRFEGLAGEQRTMFLTDPSGNALEFKAFRDPDQLFAH
jgi:extradiol dioxygenase family protein